MRKPTIKECEECGNEENPYKKSECKRCGGQMKLIKREMQATLC